MPIVRLVAEGVGPFKRLDLDFSDGKGNPHLGPHVLAGVNGAGKSTVLRSIAWALSEEGMGFPLDLWAHALAGHKQSRVLLQLKSLPDEPTYSLACLKWPERRYLGSAREAVADWVSAITGLSDWVQDTRQQPGLLKAALNPRQADFTLRFVGQGAAERPQVSLGAYSPTKSLQHLSRPDLGPIFADPFENALSFESTVRNEALQGWLLGLYSRRAIAKERHQPTETYRQSLERFEKSLEEIYGADVTFEVNIEPSFEPRLRVFGHSLNFSQLPDGIRSTVAWIADYMMRQDAIQWDPKLKGKRPGILLLDEVDAHLHPMWQRRLLPAMRAALPDVQIIVTSHSPFVISSCPNSKVHVMDLNKNGSAYLKASCDAPIGLSVTTTLKEIFGVESRFDIRTERELDEWNELKRHEIRPGLSAPEAKRLKTLTRGLSERSEELKSIVATASVPAELLGALAQSAGKTGNGARRRVRR